MAVPTSGHVKHAKLSKYKPENRCRSYLPFCDQISRFPVISDKAFFRPKVTVGLRNFTRWGRSKSKVT